MAKPKQIPTIYCFRPLDWPDPPKLATPHKLRKIAAVESLRGPVAATRDTSKAVSLTADTKDGASAIRETISKNTSAEECTSMFDAASHNLPPRRDKEALHLDVPLDTLDEYAENDEESHTSATWVGSLLGPNKYIEQFPVTTKHLLPSVSSTGDRAPSGAIPEGTPKYEQSRSLHACCLPESCCIVDLRLPGYPVTFTSFDMLPSEQLQATEPWYLENSVNESSFQLINVRHGSEEICNVILRGDLLERATGTTSYQFFMQVNVTGIVQTEYSVTPDEDVWLSIACEELNKTCIRTRRNPTTVSDSPPSFMSKSMVHRNLSMIQSSYKNSFVLSVDTRDAMDYHITHVSRRLQSIFQPHIMTLQSAFPRDAGRIVGLLSLGEKFITNAKRTGNTETEWICCVPMFGPQLNCWLCFFVTTIYNE